MATVEPETTPIPNPLPTEEEKTESNQENTVLNKQPLQNRWALWFFKNDKSKTFDLSLSSTLLRPFGLCTTISSYLDGIEPMWKDEKNKRGGQWLITLNKQYCLLCLTGESFDDYNDDVYGAVVNVRAKGRVYKEKLGLPPKIVTGYQSHADTATKSSSTTKNRSVVSHRQLPQAIKIWELKESLFKSRMDCI
ncbi:hypothetical protein JEQ12_011483 [Ovis aries]|uniref:Uncharacterized protein n=1 Tax=Ovis aries TaxID=9940 RepID=A0A835ZRU3_SHEEP|nr:hypothetical protein JEQ12_011483 [Ovis aries]